MGDALLLRDGACKVEQAAVVGFAHVGEAGAGGKVFTTEGMFGEEVDVVGDEHDVTNLETFVRPPRGVGHEEGLDAEFVHHADGERHLLHRVALVVVEASLHGQHFLSAEPSENQAARMPFDRRHRKVGDVGIRKGFDDLDFFGQSA